MTNRHVTIVDYGMGNLLSIANAFGALGCDTRISSDPRVILNSEALVLPGVGSFRKAVSSLKASGLDLALSDAVIGRRRKILGICLGMQLMGLRSSEDGNSEGLHFIDREVGRFDIAEIGANKVPHVGFNSVRRDANSLLLKNLPSLADFYFVHSYRMLPGDIVGVQSSCNYGVNFLAAFESENIFATQFHPEKSQANGLVLLNNFLMC